MGSRRLGCPLPTTPLDSRAFRLGTLTNLFVDLSFFFFCCIKNNKCEELASCTRTDEEICKFKSSIDGWFGGFFEGEQLGQIVLLSFAIVVLLFTLTRTNYYKFLQKNQISNQDD